MEVCSLETLHATLSAFVDTEWFQITIGLVILLNPFAIFPQVVKVFRAPSVEGISVFAFSIFALIQVAFGFDAVRTENFLVFVAMLLSFLQSCTIIVTVLVRRT